VVGWAAAWGLEPQPLHSTRVGREQGAPASPPPPGTPPPTSQGVELQVVLVVVPAGGRAGWLSAGSGGGCQAVGGGGGAAHSHAVHPRNQLPPQQVHGGAVRLPQVLKHGHLAWVGGRGRPPRETRG
jgi:hypothetical protein